ncbi:MAG: 23S rRNA (uracil(1939)-C(5))-methyltransferase RlmD [Bacteroidales bacterium]|nr:23S rRNA (uracil(1939)-C(5))-methyltransferase RlmD [Candidatus Colimorpha onthohippi]
MRKKNRTLPLIADLLITDAGAEGMAIAKVDGLVVFVPFAMPGDIVDVQLIKKRKSYAEGRVVAFKQYASNRQQPMCPHFGVCGGCKWQMMPYEEQLMYKQKQVRDNLEHLGQVDTSLMQPICGSQDIYFYRNKLEYTFSVKEWKQLPPSNQPIADEGWGALGFHAPTCFDKVISIEHCALQQDPSNAIRLSVRDYARNHQIPCYDIRNHTGFLRNIIIRCSSLQQWMVIVVVAENRSEWLFPLLDYLKQQFPQITSLQYVVNTKYNDTIADLDVIPYDGMDYIEEVMDGYKGRMPLRFKINPKSFYQTNSRQAQRLYSFVADFAGLTGGETLYDLYTGTGTIALFLAAMCGKVVGIEYVEEAVVDARKNAEINGFDNTTFFSGDMAKVLTQAFIEENGRPDVVVTDPPRAGMHPKVIEQLLAARPSKIVYVSCNPATQARDLKLLSDSYSVKRIQPVDMFPHTHHVENVVELVCKGK